MARIRSIKPEFFTSETLARVSISARLTFIGLWTYVDDNGVGVDNERLIDAALYPLDDDPLESLRRVSEDLRSLSAEGVITRYEVAGRRYLHVTNWDEHQKISHPGKPRYPLPPPNLPEPPTSEKTDPPEGLRNDSGGSPESVANDSALSREQGAGSRDGEQGSSIAPSALFPSPADAADDTPASKRRVTKQDPLEGFDEFWSHYPKKVGKEDAKRAYEKAIKRGAKPREIADGALAYAMDCRLVEDPHYIKHPSGWLNGGRWADSRASPHPSPDATEAMPPRPEWKCRDVPGGCDERTRQRFDAEGRPYRCPDCHPLTQKASTT